MASAGARRDPSPRCRLLGRDRLTWMRERERERVIDIDLSKSQSWKTPPTLGIRRYALETGWGPQNTCPSYDNEVHGKKPPLPHRNWLKPGSRSSNVEEVEEKRGIRKCQQWPSTFSGLKEQVLAWLPKLSSSPRLRQSWWLSDKLISWDFLGFEEVIGSLIKEAREC